MAGLTEMVRLAAEITLRDGTGPGAASAARSFERVGEAADGAARQTERTLPVTEGAARAYQALERRLDPLTIAMRRFEKDQETLNRAFQSGVISGDRYEDVLSRLQRAHDRTRDRIEQSERAQRSANAEFRSGVDVLGRFRGALLGLAAGFSLQRVVTQTREALSALAELDDRARNLGGSSEAGFLQGARAVLAEQGVDQGAADASLLRLTRSIGELRFGGGQLSSVLGKLDGGDEIARQLRDADSLREQYLLVIDTLNKVPEATDRAVVAAAAFGRSGATLFGAAADDGVAGFLRLEAAAVDAGLVIENDVIARAAVLDDRLDHAGRTVQTQLRRGFVELGPIIAALAERAANLTKNIVDDLRTNRLVGQDVADTQTPDELRDQQRALQERIAERRLGLAFRTGGAPLSFTPADIVVLEERLAEVNQELERLDNIGVRSVNDLVKALDGGAVAARRLNDPLAAAFSELEQAQERLVAARGGADALAAFDDQARIDALIEEAGLVGDQADEFRRVQQEIADAARETATLTAAFGRAAGAASRVAVDPLDGVAAAVARLEELAAASAAGPDALEAAERRLDIEAEIADVRERSRNAGVAFDEAEARALVERRFAAQDAIAEGRTADAPEAFADDYRRALYDVADDFISRLARGDPDAFRAFARSLRDILLDSVLAPVRNAFANLIQSALGGLGGGAGAAGGGGALSGLFGGVDRFLRQRGVNGAALLGAAGAAYGGFALGGGLADQVNGARGETGSRIGGVLGGVAGAFVGLPIIGSLAGSFLGDILGGIFGGKPSNKFARGLFDPDSGAITGLSQKDDSEEARENARARDDFIEALGGGLDRIAEITGARFSETLALEINSRDGIKVGFGGFASGGGPRDERIFSDAEEAIAFATERLVDSLQGGDAALVAAARELAGLDDIAERLERLKGVLADPDEYIDPLRERIDALREAFEGLDTSAGALKDAYDRAAQQLADSVNREAERFLAENDNAELAAIEDLLEQQAARREEIDRLETQGGTVDGSLIAEFQRRQLLNQFNTEDRFAQASDGAAFAIQQLIDQQADERAAFRRAIEGSGGLLTEADFLGLVRAQEAERFNAFGSLSDEDKARLSGRGDDFDDVTLAYARAVEKLIAETDRLSQSFEAERQRLTDQVARRGEEVASLDAAISGIDLRRGLATPGETLERLRSQLEDVGARALSDDEETRRAARAALPEIAEAYADRLEEVFASSSAAANGLDFTRDLLERVRDRAEGERSIAQQQLDELEASRAVLEAIRDRLAEPQLDTQALLAAVSGLSADNALSALSRELVDLETRRLAESERLAAALEALVPADVGLVAGLSAGPGAPSYAGGEVVSFPLTPRAGDGRTAIEDSDDVAEAIRILTNAVDEQTAEIVSIEAARKPREEQIEAYLKAIAQRRGQTL